MISKSKSGYVSIVGKTNAGTGKTFVFNAVLDYVRYVTQQGTNGIGIAMAALLLAGGRTTHDRFKLGKDVDEWTTCILQKGDALCEIIRRAKIIIWDEATMASKHLLKTVDHCLRDVMEKPNTAFGGKLMVLGGDFRQTLPVVPDGGQSRVINECIQSSPLWGKLNVMRLK